jgi:hypothetical protein
MATAKRATTQPWRTQRAAAATYLAEWSSFDPEALLGDDALVGLAFTEATSMHPLHPSCEHCVRLQLVRDVLLGAPPEGALFA